MLRMTSSSARGLCPSTSRPAWGPVVSLVAALLLGTGAGAQPETDEIERPAASEIESSSPDLAANANESESSSSDLDTDEPAADPQLEVATEPASPAANQALVLATEQRYGRNSL